MAAEEEKVFTIRDLWTYGVQTEPPIPLDVQRRFRDLGGRVLAEPKTLDERGIVREHKVVLATTDLAKSAEILGDDRTARFLRSQERVQVEEGLPTEVRIDIRAGTIATIE